MSYRTAPLATPGTPPGIPYIIGNEAAERFSFYGMRGILVLFMTTLLMNSSGRPELMSEKEASSWYHTFMAAVYITPLLGAIVADRWWGKYKTIMILAVVYCLGHLALALDTTRLGLLMGLSLISIGSGGIKGCVAAHVGDQFGASNAALLPRVYSWFYFSINTGSFLAFLTIPPLLENKNFGPHWAFGVPGIVMAAATVIFWLGRRKYAHIPPRGPSLWKETFSPQGLRAAGRMAVIYAFVAMFWALFDQTGSRWVLQAARMDLTFFGWELSPAMLQAVNPVLVLALIPLCAYQIYPAISRVWPLTPLRKIGLGLFITVPSFLISAWVESRLGAGDRPGIIWQVLAYVFITLGEVLISITALEFSYTQAPKSGKSLMLGLNYAAVTLGNLFTAAVNKAPEQWLAGANYYLFFAACMAGAALIYVPVAKAFKPQDILQDEAPPGEDGGGPPPAAPAAAAA